MSDRINWTSDVHTAGLWAKWFGIVKVIAAVISYLVFVAGGTGSTILLVEIIFNGLVGIVSIFVGVKLLTKLFPRLIYPTLLIGLYGVIVLLQLVTIAVSLNEPFIVAMIIGFVITSSALYFFVRGRNAILNLEALLGTPDLE